MTAAVPGILERIVEHKRSELASLHPQRAALERQAANRSSATRDFTRALTQTRPAIIAELKKASPSKGLLAPEYEPTRIARSYEAGGAAALSVLTDTEFFQGGLQHLQAARAATNIPVLRKDFTIDPLHVIEAAAHNADAILLIAAILSDAELRAFRESAESFGMAALVEVHDREELRRAIASGARIIGVNNRNLRTFEVHLETAVDLAAHFPTGVIRVAESGIRSAHDVRKLSEAGYHAFLVGEHLMTSTDPSTALRNLAA